MVRETPSCSAKSRVEGSFMPPGKAPERIAFRNPTYTWRNSGPAPFESGITNDTRSGASKIPRISPILPKRRSFLTVEDHAGNTAYSNVHHCECSNSSGDFGPRIGPTEYRRGDYWKSG